MDHTIERILLRERNYCELPDENGSSPCMRPASHIITLKSQFTVAVCAQCAAYVQKEAGHNVKHD